MSKTTTFEAHVDRMELSKPPVRRGDSIRFWNAVCRCDECAKAYVRVRVTVEVIEEGLTIPEAMDA